MNSATYRTLREACGLSQQAAADFHGVAVRTIKHWDNLDGDIPDGVAEEITGLDGLIDRLARLRALAEMDRAEDEPTVLTRYRTEADFRQRCPDGDLLPWPSHAAVLARILQVLSHQPRAVQIVWGPPPA